MITFGTLMLRVSCFYPENMITSVSLLIKHVLTFTYYDHGRRDGLGWSGEVGKGEGGKEGMVDDGVVRVEREGKEGRDGG